MKEIFWLIWSIEHGAWWKAGGNGYTLDQAEAGRYTFGAAQKIVESANRYPRKENEPMEAMLPEPKKV